MDTKTIGLILIAPFGLYVIGILLYIWGYGIYDNLKTSDPGGKPLGVLMILVTLAALGVPFLVGCK